MLLMIRYKSGQDCFPLCGVELNRKVMRGSVLPHRPVQPDLPSCALHQSRRCHMHHCQAKEDRLDALGKPSQLATIPSESAPAATGINRSEGEPIPDLPAISRVGK